MKTIDEIVAEAMERHTSYGKIVQGMEHKPIERKKKEPKAEEDIREIGKRKERPWQRKFRKDWREIQELFKEARNV